MYTTYLAIRDQLIADVKTAWGVTKVHKARIEVDQSDAEYGIVELEGPIVQEFSGPVNDEYAATFRVVGRFKKSERISVNDARVLLSSQLRERIYRNTTDANQYAGVSHLPIVVSICSPETTEPDDLYFETDLVFTCKFAEQRRYT